MMEDNYALNFDASILWNIDLSIEWFVCVCVCVWEREREREREKERGRERAREREGGRESQ